MNEWKTGTIISLGADAPDQPFYVRWSLAPQDSSQEICAIELFPGDNRAHLSGGEKEMDLPLDGYKTVRETGYYLRELGGLPPDAFIAVRNETIRREKRETKDAAWWKETRQIVSGILSKEPPAVRGSQTNVVNQFTFSRRSRYRR